MSTSSKEPINYQRGNLAILNECIGDIIKLDITDSDKDSILLKLSLLEVMMKVEHRDPSLPKKLLDPVADLTMFSRS